MKNETTIFQVLSNLNHSGTRYTKGQIFEGNLAEFGNLVTDGVLRVVNGAESIEEAKEIVAKEGETAVAESTTPEKEPENTWGPKPDEVPEVKDEVVHVVIVNLAGFFDNTVAWFIQPALYETAPFAVGKLHIIESLQLNAHVGKHCIRLGQTG